MGIFTFSTDTTRPEPYLFSVMRSGETRERFIARNGNVISFDEDSGEGIVYVSKITDASGKVSTKEFTLGCARPADCPEGPVLKEILNFDANKVTYRFHGAGVDQIERQIISSNGLLVDSAIDIPSGAVVTSAFRGPLANGTYTLKLKGYSCYSELGNGIEFTITDNSSALAWWIGFPNVSYDNQSGQFHINLAINKAGEYPFEVKNPSDTVVNFGVYTFSPGNILWFGAVTPGDYDVKVGPLTGTVTVPGSPPSECPQGPELLSANSISPTRTEFRFHGEDVFLLEWFIRTLADVVEYFGTVEPGGARVTIDHPALSAGSHNLLIKGASCTTNSDVTVDNMDFTVVIGSLNITSVGVEQLPQGNYRLTVNFTGGNPNYTITVRSLSNATIATFPNTTGSPAVVTLPAGIAPQTVKVMVMDVTNAIDEENAVLPPPVMKMSFLQAPNFSTVFTKSPMDSDGSIFFIGNESGFNWDVQVDLPNGGLWDYIEKRLRKKGSDWVEKNIAAATGLPQNYAVQSTSSTESLFLPRNGTAVTIDGQNVFKTAGEWEFRAIARKGGPSGAIVAQLTRTFILSAPASGSGSGIFLYNKTGDVAGPEIGELNATGSTYPKPAPYYDLVVKNFNGATFDRVVGNFRRKIGDTFQSRWGISKDFSPPTTTVNISLFSMFWGPLLTDGMHADIFSQEPQTWEVEFIAYMGLTPVGSRKAVFDFTVNSSSDQGFTNRGFKTTVVNGKSYQTQNGIDFGSEVLPSGNVRIFYPATRKSINGQNTCYPWVYLNHVRLNPVKLAALVNSTGLALPKGKHTFSVKYHSNVVNSYQDVITGGSLPLGVYQLAGEITEESFKYSQCDDYFTVTIRDV